MAVYKTISGSRNKRMQHVMVMVMSRVEGRKIGN